MQLGVSLFQLLGVYIYIYGQSTPRGDFFEVEGTNKGPPVVCVVVTHPSIRSATFFELLILDDWSECSSHKLPLVKLPKAITQVLFALVLVGRQRSSNVQVSGEGGGLVDAMSWIAGRT